MGTDAHAILEVTNNLGSWVGLERVILPRSYEVFAKLASVRIEDTDFKAEDCELPKGLPKDTSDLSGYWLSFYAGDAHSHTVVGLKELIELYDASGYVINKVFPLGFREVGVHTEDDCSTRVIIFFDG